MAERTGGAAASGDREFCREMLPKVSRTFALCIRLLPRDLEHPVLVAYLLCRVADTIEDTVEVPAAAKRDLFEAFARSLDPGGPDATPLARAFAAPTNDEEVLAREADRVLRQFRDLPVAQREAVRPWVQEMARGMASFAARQSGSPGTRLETLGTVEELDRYCYYVAGTVGHLLTALFRLHAGTHDPGRYARLESLATSFGLGLQLTNIIKDVGDDQRRGWSFVPRQLCEVVGIRPEELQEPAHRDAGLAAMHMLIEKAERHLLDALEYSTTLRRRDYGVRLFCLTSLYFAVRTLRLADRDARLLDPGHKVKISRAQVRRTLLITRGIAPSNAWVRAYFRHLAGPEWWARRSTEPRVPEHGSMRGA